MAKQTEMDVEGIKRRKIAEVDTAAEHYVEQRDTRMKWTKKEKEAKTALLKVMQKHKLNAYRDDEATPPLVVTLIEGEDDVKVSIAKEEPEETDDKPKRGRSAKAQRALAAVNDEPGDKDEKKDEAE